MAYEHLLIHREHGVEFVTLDRPAVRNAFNPALVESLHDWAAALHGDAEVRAAVLSGGGKAFCAGADLNQMAEALTLTRAENERDAARLASMFEALDQVPVPLVGRVHGAAMGGGVGLVAVCDVVVADETATFAFSEVRLGLVPSVIAPFVLAKIGRSAARELFLTARTFSAARARGIGLVHDVVAADALDDAVQRYSTGFSPPGRTPCGTPRPRSASSGAGLGRTRGG